jgi:hypothetical protein
MSKKPKLTILQVATVMNNAYTYFLDLITVFLSLEDLKAAIKTLKVSNNYLLAGEEINEEKRYQNLRNCGLSKQNFQKLVKLIDGWGEN